MRENDFDRAGQPASIGASGHAMVNLADSICFRALRQCFRFFGAACDHMTLDSLNLDFPTGECSEY
jgi:hypothetical protein